MFTSGSTARKLRSICVVSTVRVSAADSPLTLADDVPIDIEVSRSSSDRVYRGVSYAAGATTLLLMASATCQSEYTEGVEARFVTMGI